MDQDQCRWGFQCHYKYWGVGDIFRDEVGSYVGSFAHKISHVTSLKMIEALAARNGVCLSWERKWQQVIIEGDALHVVQALGNLQGGSSGSNFLVEDIKSNLRNFVSSKVCHIH